MDKAYDHYAKLAKVLSENRGKFVTSELISSKTGIAREQLAKEISFLRRYGYKIGYRSDNGYKLQAATDEPVPWELDKLLRTHQFGRSLLIYKQATGSTQSVAKHLAESKNAPHGTVVIAKRQTLSVGRMGRTWFSPEGGLWLSIVVRPKFNVPDSTFLSLMAPVSICAALRQATLLDVTLKWPNDLLIGGRKVAGILIDINLMGDEISYAIIGIGINLNFASSELIKRIDLSDSTQPTTILDESHKDTSLLTLAASVLNQMENDYLELERDLASETKPAVLEKWKSFDHTLGRRVEVSYGNKKTKGLAFEISEHGSLIVKLGDGSLREFNSGTLRFV
ncbi:MAG: biotin--[acetyl-CoA-carboxylase] ligase [Nitrososphaera sp.]